MVVGLKGFTRYGRLNKYFMSGYFPLVWNWTPRHVDKVIYDYSVKFQVRPYDLVAFSDGGTVAHEIAAIDPRCQSLTVHSGLFFQPTSIPNIPIHLIATSGDRTGMYEQTLNAFNFYKENNANVTLTILEAPPRPPYHVFYNAPFSMNRWAADQLGRTYPFKFKYYRYWKVVYQEC